MKKNVLQLTFSIIMFLFAIAVQASDIALVITAGDIADIADDDEKAAADWFIANVADGQIITTDEILNATVNLDDYKLLWISIDRVGTGAIPAEFTDATVLNAITTFYKSGGNVLLTNHATQYIVNLGRTTRNPGIVGAGTGSKNSDLWGVNANIGLTNNHTSHSLYSGLSVDNTTFSHPFFPLIGPGHKEDHNSMWDLNNYGYSNNILDAFEIENNAVVLGTWQHVTDLCCAGIVEFKPGDEYNGRCIAIGLAAYEWSQNSGTNSFQSNIELITSNAINYLTSDPIPSSTGLIFSLKYDEDNGVKTTYEEMSGSILNINNQFNKPERVKGVTGNALRTDGFSTWVETDQSLNIYQNMTIGSWVVLESYPSDEELPYGSLTPSAFISKTDNNLGFAININTFGIWSFSVNISGTKYTCKAPAPFPLYEWSHIAASVNSNTGEMSLFLNGEMISSTSIPVNGVISLPSSPLIIGKSNINKQAGIFLINALNGTFDNTEIYNDVLTPSQIHTQYNTGLSTITTTGEEAIQVSSIRFEDDIQRPRFHGMPPANWTNEPHGLVEYNGEYHMFYQRTPNGPFKYQMHWGHMVSKDFVTWENRKDALWPELLESSTSGYDMKGIWSGDVVVENNVAHAFYTCVNHSNSFNPGIAHATSSGTLDNWTKQGPVIDKQFVNDFRDPYLWKEGNTWHMIIGAALGSGGGLDHYTSTDLNNWIHSPNFCTDFGAMDIGSVIWEMPVFESIGNGKYILVVNPIGNSVTKYGPKYTRGVYWIGTWNGTTFTPDFITPKNLDVIHGHLSPTVVRNAFGDLVALGMVDERWESQAQLDAGWCHVYSLPRVWSLMSNNQSLGQSPVPELSSLRVPNSNVSFSNTRVDGTQTLSGAEGMQTEIIVELNPNTLANKYGINFLRSPDEAEITRLYYDASTQQIILDKSASSLSPYDEEGYIILGNYDEATYGKPEKFHIFIDHSIIDVFINDAVAFSSRIYVTRADSKTIQLYSEGAETTFKTVDVWQINSESFNDETVSIEKTENLQETLYQNYPNPFDNYTTIKYDIIEPSTVDIKVYDSMGNWVQTLVDEYQSFPGTFEINLNENSNTGLPLSNGIYFYSITIKSSESGEITRATKKMIKYRE